MHSKRLISLGALFAVALPTGSATAQCLAPASWFPHESTPQPTTADPGNVNCDFHRWSWQTFLWLTQTVDGNLRFITQMYSRDDLFCLNDDIEKSLPVWQDLLK